MAKHLGKLEVVEVETNDNGGYVLTFLHEELGQIRQVKLNKKKYDQSINKWVDDEEQEKRFFENIETYLGVAPDEVGYLVGKSFDVWEAETYCALWEPKEFAKFDGTMAGQILNATLLRIEEYEAKAMMVFSFEDKEYISNINWGQYIQALKKSLPDPQKKAAQLAKFEEKYHVPFGKREELYGKDFMIEVKRNNMDSTGKNPTYIDVKALPKPKK